LYAVSALCIINQPRTNESQLGTLPRVEAKVFGFVIDDDVRAERKHKATFFRSKIQACDGFSSRLNFPGKTRPEQ